MTHFTLDATLELRFPNISNAAQQHVYFSDLRLGHSAQLDVVVAVPACDASVALYSHRTRAKVVGSADLIGNTIFVRSAAIYTPGVPATSVQSRPFVRFRGSVVQWEDGAFSVVVGEPDTWPEPVSIRCSFVPGAGHLRDLKFVPNSTPVSVSGRLFAFHKNVLDVEVHDIRLDDELPCDASCLLSVLPAGMAPIVCRWLRELRAAPRRNSDLMGGATKRQSSINPRFADDRHGLPYSEAHCVQSSQVALETSPPAATLPQYASASPPYAAFLVARDEPGLAIGATPHEKSSSVPSPAGTVVPKSPAPQHSHDRAVLYPSKAAPEPRALPSCDESIHSLHVPAMCRCGLPASSSPSGTALGSVAAASSSLKLPDRLTASVLRLAASPSLSDIRSEPRIASPPSLPNDTARELRDALAAAFAFQLENDPRGATPVDWTPLFGSPVYSPSCTSWQECESEDYDVSVALSDRKLPSSSH